MLLILLQAKGILKVNIETTIGINFSLIIKEKTLSFKSVFNLIIFLKAFECSELRANALKTEGAEYNTGGAHHPAVTFPSGRALSLCNGASALCCLFAAGRGGVL